MTKDEIRKDINNRINKYGVKGAYLDLIKANTKVIKPQFKNLNTEEDLFYFVQLIHNVVIKGIKNADMYNKFKSLFYMDYVINDDVFEDAYKKIVAIVIE